MADVLDVGHLVVAIERGALRPFAGADLAGLQTAWVEVCDALGDASLVAHWVNLRASMTDAQFADLLDCPVEVAQKIRDLAAGGDF